MSPRMLLNRNVGNFNFRSLSLYLRCFIVITNLMAFIYTFSRSLINPIQYGLHSELAYSSCDLTRALYNKTKASSDKLHIMEVDIMFGKRRADKCHLYRFRKKHFEKACDKVPHQLLLQKLKLYKVDPSIINWIKAFLLVV